MPKTANTPASVLKTLMDEYQLNSFSLSKGINLSSAGTRQLVIGKAKITVPSALRLAKFFGQLPAYWLDLQREADLSEASKDKELQEIIKSISKVKKPVATKQKAAEKPAKKTTVFQKSKTATKAPDTKSVRKPRSKKSVKKVEIAGTDK